MSGIPDRLGLPHGGTGSGHPFCEYPPAPHSDFAGVQDQGTASTSASSVDFSDYFDYEAFERDRMTDVTTQSDVLSEDKAAARPSPLTLAGPGTNHGDDCPMPDAPSPELQVPHVWPRVSGPHPSRELNLDLEASPSPPPSTEMGLEAQSHTSPPPLQRKTRTVKDPEGTSQVRERRACYRCKWSRAACDAQDVCEKCSERPFSSSICIRTPLRDIVPPKFVRWNWIDPGVLMPGRKQFVEGQEYTFFITFSESNDSPHLELTARPFRLPNQKNPGVQNGFGISPSELPSQDAIQNWMERQILAEGKTDFETEMDKLLHKLVHRPQTGMRPELQHVPGPLLADLLKMKCMLKVWSCKQLFFRHRHQSQAFRFDLQFASIQDSLRLLAARAISELERKILPEIEKYLAIKDTKITKTPVMKWFLLWQMILIYRQSLSWVFEQQQTDAAPIPIEVMPRTEERHTFRETTKELFHAMIVNYSELVNKKAIKMNRIKEAGLEIFGNDCHLHAAYQRVWQTIPNFYQQVLGQVSPTDKLFIALIVEEELEPTGKARAVRK